MLLHVMICLELKTGKILWQNGSTATSCPPRSPWMMKSGATTSRDGVQVQAKTARLFRTTQPGDCAPVVVGNNVY